MKKLKYLLGLLLCMSFSLTFVACDDDEKNIETSEPILGVWYGEIDEENCELTFKNDGTATLAANEGSEVVIFKYTYKRNGSKYPLRITQRPEGWGDDWDLLLVEYVNESRILVYSDFGDGDDRLYGTMTKR